MANKDPSRTEKPTAKKINKTRQEGKVLSSADVTSFAVLFGGMILLYMMAPAFYYAFRETFRTVLKTDCRYSWDVEAVYYGGLMAGATLVKVLGPMTFGLCLVALIVMRFQVGKYFSMKALKWKFNSFNPASGIKSLIPSKQNFTKLLLTMGKVAAVGIFIYFAVRGDIDELLMLMLKPVQSSTQWLLMRCYILVFKVLIIILALAVIDYFVKKKEYYDNLMMTKQEVKDERKDAEGDPRVKSKIRSKMKELFIQSMMSALPQADVVVTNPTHVAVAIRYKAGFFAPQVVAKGLRKRAEKIKRLAKLYNIPTVEAPPLARSLYRNTKVGAYIPEQFYGAVAAILAKLHREGRKSFNVS